MVIWTGCTDTDTYLRERVLDSWWARRATRPPQIDAKRLSMRIECKTGHRRHSCLNNALSRQPSARLLIGTQTRCARSAPVPAATAAAGALLRSWWARRATRPPILGRTRGMFSSRNARGTLAASAAMMRPRPDGSSTPWREPMVEKGVMVWKLFMAPPGNAGGAGRRLRDKGEGHDDKEDQLRKRRPSCTGR